jgi:hypothetical protein
MRHKSVYILFLAALSLLVVECSKPSTTPTETDQALFGKAATKHGFSYYHGDSTIHHSSPQSAHHGYFRVRFNAIAQAALTDSGRLPVGGTFPNVKELHGDSLGTGLFGYAIIEKLPMDTDQNAGWVWGEYNLAVSGTMLHTKGASCIGCHSMNSRDDVRVFDIFP